MPELVNIKVGSLPGTKGLDATTVCPLDSKKSKKVLRMSETEKVAWLMGCFAQSATVYYKFGSVGEHAEQMSLICAQDRIYT